MTIEEQIRAEFHMKELLLWGEIIERASYGYWVRDLDGKQKFICKSTIESLKEGLKRF